MGSSLILAFSIAGLALLVFGERLGLPATIAAQGVIGLLAFLALGLSLASVTSRLNTFLFTQEGSTFWGGAFARAVMLILALSLQSPYGIAGFGAFACGMLAVLVFTPPQARQISGGRADSDRVIAILTALAALYLAFLSWPLVLGELIAATGWTPQTARIAVLLIAGLAAVLGGLDGLIRLGLRVLPVLIALCLVPFAIEWIGQVAQAKTLDALLTFPSAWIHQPMPSLAQLVSSVSTSAQAPALALAGALTGLTLGMSDVVLPKRHQRFLALLLGLTIASALLFVAWLARMHLHTTLLASLTRLSPSEWPLFAFDPALQGWLNVCGKVPRDSVDIAQACGMSASPALSQMVLDPQLALPAVAAASGWPLLLGTVWTLAIPLLLMLALGFLVHAAARGISENVLFHFLHPRALRAWRLAMARAVTLAILAGLYLAPATAPIFNDRLGRVIALGILILLGVTVLSTWMRIAVAAILRWRTRKQPIIPLAPITP